MLQHVLLLLAGLAALGALLWVVGTLNHLIRLRNQVAQAFAGVDVLLQQRYDELPRLVEICKGAMQHERATLERIIALRASLGTDAGGLALDFRVGLENQLTDCLGLVAGRVEDYPQLRALEGMQRLAERLRELEDAIADRRELFNDAVTHFNDGVSQVPGVVFAKLLRYAPLSPLAVPQAVRATPGVKLG